MWKRWEKICDPSKISSKEEIFPLDPQSLNLLLLDIDQNNTLI